MQTKLLVSVLLIGWLLTGCSSFSIPNHGGGKRFLYEQKLLSTASTQALNDWSSNLDEEQLEQLKGGFVNVQIYSMGDEGGGMDGGLSSFDFGGILGGFNPNKNQQFTPAASASSSGSPTDSASHAVANARDLEWLKGAVIRELAQQGIVTQLTPQNAKTVSEYDLRENYLGDLYVLFPEFGLSKLGSNWLIFNMSTLSASVACEVFFLPSDDKAVQESPWVDLGQGEGSAAYRTAFFLGMGPIAGGRFGSKKGTIGPSPFID